MDYNIKEVASRLRGLRETLDFSIEEFCKKTGVPTEEYTKIEAGEKDFSITFLYKCAEVFKVELIEILTGQTPKLSSYSIVRKGNGLSIERRERFEYHHLAYLFKDKSIEPLLVKAPLDRSEVEQPIKLSVHEGQEFDYVLKGSLKFVIGEHSEVLNEGDSVYYNSITPHGMIAIGEDDCEFMAILIKK